MTENRQVFRAGTQIVNPTVEASSISWSTTDGNTTNAQIEFLNGSTDTCIWGAEGETGHLFEGTIQFPGEGPLDYRGTL